MMKNLTGVYTNCFVAALHTKKAKKKLSPLPRDEPSARDRLRRVVPSSILVGRNAAWSVTAPAEPKVEVELGPTNTSRFPSPPNRSGLQRTRSPFHSRSRGSPPKSPTSWNLSHVEAAKAELMRQMEVNRRLLGTHREDLEPTKVRGVGE